MPENKPKNIIGVFDSGLGGLSVLKYFLQKLSKYNYLYLGDTARLPYGSKSPEMIYEYTRQAVDFLFQKGCNLIIIACNTASAQALRKLQQEYLSKNYPNRRILGVIRPLVEAASDKRFKKVGVLGTKATVSSDAYKNELQKINPDVEVYQQSAPLLVPLIEEGWLKKPETKMILKKYLRPLKTKQIDTLILACTHYPFLYKQVVKIMGKNIKIPHPGEIVADSLKNYINNHPELKLKEVSFPSLNYYVTDSLNNFRVQAEKFLEKPVKNIKQIDISEL